MVRSADNRSLQTQLSPSEITERSTGLFSALKRKTEKQLQDYLSHRVSDRHACIGTRSTPVQHTCSTFFLIYIEFDPHS